MTTLLHLNTSLFAAQGASHQLSKELVQQLLKQSPASKVIYRDFAEQSVPHLDGHWLTAISTAAHERSTEQAEKAAYSDQLIKELQTADTLVIGLPMYNFGVPSMLKAWFDHVARAGTTFKYTETGPVGLLTNKKVYLVATRGGIHKDQASDIQIPFVKTFLNFIGLSDVEVIYAEGLNLSGDHRAQAFHTAREQIAALV
ncbi:MAG: NAD(P)H-dependent oxidoreductase [Hahellaceae bacterium]|nr:NAD(P)H-dependent oxidoreductase [Hahellaceae bacterium]